MKQIIDSILAYYVYTTQTERSILLCKSKTISVAM